MAHPEQLESRLVYEDEHFHASHHVDDGRPSLLGVVLIQTKRHVNDLSELNEPESKGLGELVKDVSVALKAEVGAAWTYCYSFLEGARHVHVFVTARYPGVPSEYVRLNIGDWPLAPLGDVDEVEALASRLRVRLTEAASKGERASAK